MNGHYKIPLRPDESAESNPKVKALLRSLDPGAKWTIRVWNEPLRNPPGGSSSFGRTGTESCYCEIRARGGKAKRHKASTPKQSPPPVPSLESLRKRLDEAQKTLQSARHRLPTNLRNQWKPEGYDYREWMIREVESRTKHRAIGRTVAKILSRHGVHAERADSIRHYKAEDYADLDIACGRKVDRQSKVSERSMDRHHGYLGWIVSYYAGSWRFGHDKPKEIDTTEEDGSPNCIQSFLNVKLEVEYLTEMVRLATK